MSGRPPVPCPLPHLLGKRRPYKLRIHRRLLDRPRHLARLRRLGHLLINRMLVTRVYFLPEQPRARHGEGVGVQAPGGLEGGLGVGGGGVAVSEVVQVGGHVAEGGEGESAWWVVVCVYVCVWGGGVERKADEKGRTMRGDRHTRSRTCDEVEQFKLE